jgi:hypothetical protein
MRERDAITNRNLKAAMPACHAIVDQVTPIHDGPLAGSLLPPMIITEKGESLSEYVRRSHPDFISSMQVCSSYQLSDGGHPVSHQLSRRTIATARSRSPSLDYLISLEAARAIRKLQFSCFTCTQLF